MGCLEWFVLLVGVPLLLWWFRGCLALMVRSVLPKALPPAPAAPPEKTAEPDPDYEEFAQEMRKLAPELKLEYVARHSSSNIIGFDYYPIEGNDFNYRFLFKYDFGRVHVLVMNYAPVWDLLAVDAARLVAKRSCIDTPFVWGVRTTKDYKSEFHITHTMKRSQCTREQLQQLLWDMFREVWFLDNWLLDNGAREQSAKGR